jgi:hypothetical protein
MEEAMVQYYEHYKPKAVKDNAQKYRREKYTFLAIVSIGIIVSIYFYKK